MNSLLPAAPIALKMATKAHLDLSALTTGEVRPPGVELTVVRESVGASELARRHPDATFLETSFLQHLQQVERNDRSFSALPIFLARGFEHGSFHALQSRGLRRLEDLEGLRVGVESWSTTGNLWGRHALTDAGVSLDRIQWFVGPLREPAAPVSAGIPAGALAVPEGDTLLEMLRSGRIDAIQSGAPLSTPDEGEDPVVRILSNPWAAEQAFFRRTGLFPAHHVLRVRSTVLKANPWLAQSMVEAMNASTSRWLSSRRERSGTAVDVRDIVLADSWPPHGLEANTPMVDAICQAALVQGLLKRRLLVSEIF